MMIKDPCLVDIVDDDDDDDDDKDTSQYNNEYQINWLDKQTSHT